jgi:hypothetical protein
VTHPFHPWLGREFPLLRARRGWQEQRVWGIRPDGSAVALPLTWTSLVSPDPYLVVGRGRSRFRVEDLLELADLLQEVRR